MSEYEHKNEIPSPQVDFGLIAAQVIEQSKDKTPIEQLEIVQKFLDTVDEKADEGAILAGSGKTLSKDSIYSQFSSLRSIVRDFYGKASEDAEYEALKKNPSLVISRSGGLRPAVDAMLQTPDVADALIELLDRREREKKYGPIAHELGVKGVSESLIETPEDKYTEEYVKANPFHHMLDKSLTDEEYARVMERIRNMDLRSDEQKRADATEQANEDLRRRRVAADHRYNLALQSGATQEDAINSANRSFRI